MTTTSCWKMGCTLTVRSVPGSVGSHNVRYVGSRENENNDLEYS
jgi:hypothetical protein